MYVYTWNHYSQKHSMCAFNILITHLLISVESNVVQLLSPFYKHACMMHTHTHACTCTHTSTPPASIFSIYVYTCSQHEVVFCYTILEENKRLMLILQASLGAQGDAHTSNLLDCFFPFDPYWLQRSVYMSCDQMECSDWAGTQDNINCY